MQGSSDLATTDPHSLESRARELVIALGLATRGEPVSVSPVGGGVSSDIAKVVTSGGVYCVKFALAQLRVKETWTAPLTRNLAEYEWLTYVSRIDPTIVPIIHGRDASLSGFVMEFLDPERYGNWKTELLAGRVDAAFAAAVGSTLGRIHRHAAFDRDGRSKFSNQDDFDALRLDPYLRFTATRHPDLAAHLLAIADELKASRISLVHGDVSPKNILKGPNGPIFVDAECAVEGDPAFDAAFCLNHLVIKAVGGIAPAAQLQHAAVDYWQAYLRHVDWEPPQALAQRVARILPALMLARVDGKSPVEYLSEPSRIRLRSLSRTLLAATPSVEEIIAVAAP